MTTGDAASIHLPSKRAANQSCSRTPHQSLLPFPIPKRERKGGRGRRSGWWSWRSCFIMQVQKTSIQQTSNKHRLWLLLCKWRENETQWPSDDVCSPPLNHQQQQQQHWNDEWVKKRAEDETERQITLGKRTKYTDNTRHFSALITIKRPDTPDEWQDAC